MRSREDKMDKLKTQILQTIREHRMVERGSGVIVALSGGADSVCLLLVLKELAQELGIRLRAVHVHHGLRGEEADRDAEFAVRLCAEQSVPCHMIKAEVRGLAREKGMSEEEAGRTLRYEILEQEARQWETEPVRIAVAHHRRDQAETILHNLFRGCGLAGLRGMPYVRGRIIRPLLDAERSEIEAWLQNRGQDWVQDSTNDTDHYTRNRIRSQLLPLIEAQVNQGAEGNILRMGHLAAMADAFLEKQAGVWLETWGVCTPQEILLPAAPLLDQEPILASYSILLALRRLAGTSRDLGWVHVEQVRELAEGAAGRRISLPAGLAARREYEGVVCFRQSQELAAVSLPVVETAVFPRKKGVDFPKNRYTKWFDYDKIKDTPRVRTRQTGDYIVLADGSRKTLKRFMIDEKIPRQERDAIPLLADGSHIMWVIGWRISEYYKIDSDTGVIFQAQVPGGPEEEERTEEKAVADKIRVLLTEEEVDHRINEVAAAISRDYAGKDIHLICILKGGVFFTCELAKRLTVPVSMDFMSVSSYGGGTVSSGVVRIVKDLDDTLENKEVLIVEDIIDSGRTLAYLIEVLKQRNPKSIRLCTLLDKPERRVKKQVKVDYTCFTIPDEFVVGYGLDYDQKYRNLPYIGVVEQEA